MPMKGYLKTSDSTRISTISVDGRKERRKKLDLTRYNSKTGRTSMYVRDCEEHDSPQTIGGLIPVELFSNTGQAWTSQGIFKCCVLCWRVIDPTFPVVSEQPGMTTYPRDSMKRNLATARAAKRDKSRNRGEQVPLADRIWVFLDGRVNEWFTVYEIMEAVQASRTGVIREMRPLIKTGVYSVRRGGHGRGDATKYSHEE